MPIYLFKQFTSSRSMYVVSEVCPRRPRKTIAKKKKCAARRGRGKRKDRRKRSSAKSLVRNARQSPTATATQRNARKKKKKERVLPRAPEEQTKPLGLKRKSKPPKTGDNSLEYLLVGRAAVEAADEVVEHLRAPRTCHHFAAHLGVP